jgi:large conductance mechanosensitive channel
MSDILLPPISLLPFLSKNLDEKFAVLRAGPLYDDLDGYNTLKIALEDGAVVMAYG